MKLSAITLLTSILCFGPFANATSTDVSVTLDKAIAGEHRAESNILRDKYRHPKETLLFFGLQPDMTVVEIWPSRGWYTEILAPVLHDKGQLYAAGFATSAKKTPQWRRNMAEELEKKFKRHPEVYGNVKITELSVPEKTEIAPEGTADMVLTFRNVHNWMKGKYAPSVFTAMFKALKPGGILGVVEHRAKPGTDWETMITSGYVTEAQVKQFAKRAGFEFVGSSEVNANEQDDTNHPKGVWTLPPSLRLKEVDKEKYLTIGESDRMTLLFKKP